MDSNDLNEEELIVGVGLGEHHRGALVNADKQET